MTYNELLNELIEKSGKMLKEIAAECTEKYNVKLTNLYLSNLKTNPGRIASDDISRAIAKVCGAKYEDILVVQAYLDKAPAPIITFLEYAHRMITSGADLMKMFQSEDICIKDKIVKEVERLQSQCLAEFICEAIEEAERNADQQLLEVITPIFEKQNEPKWMVISPEQMKEIRLINESDIKKVLSE